MNKKRLFFSLGMVILGLGLYVHGSTSNPSTMQSHLLWIKLWGIPLGLLLLMFFPKRKTRLEPIEAKKQVVTDPRLTRQLLLLIAFSSIVPILIPLFARHYSTPTWVIMLISYSIPLLTFLIMAWLISSAKASQATETPELSTEQIIDYTQQDTDEHKTRNKLWGILILVLLVVLGFFISFQQGLHSTTP